MLPTCLQLLCLSLDLYLIAKLQQGMARNYLIFALVRSFVRAYAQWLEPTQTWVTVYWWGEGVGYIVTIILIFSITSHLLSQHVNTSLFYSLAGLMLVCIALWHIPQPLSYLAWMRVGSTARLSAAFLLFVAMILQKNWDPMTKWLGWGITINIAAQTIGAWFELQTGPTLRVSLVHQLGFLCLQLAWVVGIGKAKPIDSVPIARLAAGL